MGRCVETVSAHALAPLAAPGCVVSREAGGSRWAAWLLLQAVVGAAASTVCDCGWALAAAAAHARGAPLSRGCVWPGGLVTLGWCVLRLVRLLAHARRL